MSSNDDQMIWDHTDLNGEYASIFIDDETTGKTQVCTNGEFTRLEILEIARRMKEIEDEHCR